MKTSMKPPGTSIGAKKGPNKEKEKKGEIFKGNAVLMHFFQDYGRESKWYGLLTCQGTLWNQKEAMKTSKET